MNKTILIGVTGGIAAFKILDVARQLVAQHYDVEVIMTPSATAIVKPEEFATITGKPVHTNLFEKDFDYRQVLKDRKVEHIELAGKSSLMVIAPATANVIAKLAHGIADDFVTTTALAATCPILVYPSMNVYMWTNPATQENIRILRTRGITVIEPESGLLACGYEGKGKLADPKGITAEIIKMVEKSNSLQGKTVVVTAGATIDPIDDVRVITNRSSGKMGVAIAESCFLRGAHVILLRSRTSVNPRYQCEEHEFETPEDLEQLMKTYVMNADLCFHSAAVSDFAVSHKIEGKVASDEPLPLELTPRTKILTKIKTWNPNVFLIGFKAEWNVSKDQLIATAKEKIQAAGADMIVANDVGKPDRGFSVDTNEVICVSKSGESISIPLGSKREIAEKIVEYVVLNSHPREGGDPEKNTLDSRSGRE